MISLPPPCPSHLFDHEYKPLAYAQLAKLIVNSGGAAALVDYVADAQVKKKKNQDSMRYQTHNMK